MPRTATYSRSYSDPVTALGLLFVGIAALCLAVLYPMGLLATQASPLAVASGTLLVVPVDTLVVVAGLLVVSTVATTLGLLVLFLRL
jgi:hypothetical protein